LSSALLASISHDLKTPLAKIYGAAAMLRNRRCVAEDRESANLLAIVIDESERLNHFIAGLFQITKLEAGATAPNIAVHDTGEIVASALQRASKLIAYHRVEMGLPSALPMVGLDATAPRRCSQQHDGITGRRRCKPLLQQNWLTPKIRR
jgi:two-component system sensor histidine kinase KdpD